MKPHKNSSNFFLSFFQKSQKNPKKNTIIYIGVCMNTTIENFQDYEQIAADEDIPLSIIESQEDKESVPDPVLTETEKVYGIKYLYPWQRMVVENIFEAEKNKERGNQIVLLPTGAGKSLCFMVPALFLSGPTLILYPLLALMSDQERRMKEGGQEVVVFRGGQSPQERKENFSKIHNGARFILANPEVLQNENLINQLKECHISHIAIDEAHCVSEWGDTFRPAYLTLGTIVTQLAVPVVTAFTATASPEVLQRVAEVLFDGEAHIVRSESDRQNIRYYVTWTCAKSKALIHTVMKEERPLIVFCSSRKRTRELALLLQDFLHRQGETDTVKFYHAGLTREEKSKVEKWFYPKTDAILVSTCAFGMGVDKKDIKTVIHYEAPSTAEAYIQEAGRGGRDGSIAKAILLWSPLDSKVAQNYETNSRKRVLANFAESTTCRRQVLLDALGAEQAACSGCDICENTASNEAEDASIIMKFLQKTKKRYSLLESMAISQTRQNYESARKWNMRIWEESDIKEIYDSLFLENKTTMQTYFKQEHHLLKVLLESLRKLVHLRQGE